MTHYLATLRHPVPQLVGALPIWGARGSGFESRNSLEPLAFRGANRLRVVCLPVSEEKTKHAGKELLSWNCSRCSPVPGMVDWPLTAPFPRAASVAQIRHRRLKLREPQKTLCFMLHCRHLTRGVGADVRWRSRPATISRRELSFGTRISALAYRSRLIYCPKIFTHVQNCRQSPRALTYASRMQGVNSAFTRQKAKSKYINRIRLERVSQKQSSDTHETPYDRVKRCRERKINIKASECVNLASHQGDPDSIPGCVTPDFRMWESCRTMPLTGGFSRGSPVSSSLSFRSCSILTSITLIGSQALTLTEEVIGERLWSAVKGSRGRGGEGPEGVFPEETSFHNAPPTVARGAMEGLLVRYRTYKRSLLSACGFVGPRRGKYEKQSRQVEEQCSGEKIHRNFHHLNRKKSTQFDVQKYLLPNELKEISRGVTTDRFRNRVRGYRSLRSLRLKPPCTPFPLLTRPCLQDPEVKKPACTPFPLISLVRARCPELPAIVKYIC
ncbi:hypothetical protein PR048_007677 [Dryococelus australis]|uniref:Uncharacterized protein n=1 Tax=Dryococelus australis TaxID=614101 RepID=A0ABQ9HVV2_9NEOP|nr:hypothetical protein PR048_007677 [Dryococelus australis]